MINNSLIKNYNYKYINKNNLNIKNLINFSNLINKIDNDLTYFNSKIIKDNNSWKIYKKINIEFLELILKYKDNLPKELFELLKEEETIYLKEEVLLFINSELFISLELFNNKYINEEEFIKFIKTIPYLNSEIKSKLQINRRYKLNQEKNKNLLNTNLNNLEYPKNKNKIKNKKLLNYIEELNLNLIEIPIDKDIKNLELFFEKLLNLKKSLNLKTFKFNLRIKRILKYKKEGMFITSNNTIILDPRCSNRIYHELGHYIYENNLSFTFNNKRIYCSKFNNIINQYKNKNKINFNNKNQLEKYSDNSEVFAYWFENLFK